LFDQPQIRDIHPLYIFLNPELDRVVEDFDLPQYIAAGSIGGNHVPVSPVAFGE